MNNFNTKKLGNRYTLIEKAGDGGMALVYKAKCELLNRNVAVKILRPEFMEDEDFVKKFRSESQAVASLSHPNIVNVYDVGNEDGAYYIVMEYIDGITLKEYIKKHGKLEYTKVLDIIKQIAKALEHAHKNGVVHRDIKPHNILITDEGIVKVADFGIARATTSSTMTNTKTVMGSVHYVSPEQAKGSFIDNKTDIYSLGIVMYELLTGTVPFDGENPVSVAIKHIQEEIKKPTDSSINIPDGVWDIVVKSTQKDFSKRYQNLTDMINDINKVSTNPHVHLTDSFFDESTRAIPTEEIEKAINDKTQKINTVYSEDNYIHDDFNKDEYEEDFDEYKNNRKEKLKQKSKLKPFNKKSLIISILLIGIALSAIGLIVWIGYTPKEVVVPKVIGLKQEDALKSLGENNLTVEVKKVKSEKVAGEVVSVSPNEGMTVKEKSTVTLTISEGVNMVKMPKIRRLSVDDAQIELSNVGLEIGDVKRQHSDSIEKDKIISQSIDSNEQIPEGSKIDIVISDGPREKLSTVPSLIGKTLEEVKDALKRVGLNLGSVRYGTDLKYSNKVVTDQSVSEGISLKEGSTIDIVINKLTNIPGLGGNHGNGSNNGNNTDGGSGMESTGENGSNGLGKQGNNNSDKNKND